MCEDIDTALEAQEELGIEMTKGAKMMFKYVRTNIRKTNEKLDLLAEDVKSLRTAFESYQQDATKWQLVVQICKLLFGTTKRCIMTLIYVGVLLGLVHMKDIILILTKVLQ